MASSEVGRIKLGCEGLEVSAQGLGCMGMSALLRAAQAGGRDDRADPKCRGRRRDVPGHGGELWAVHERDPRRKGAEWWRREGEGPVGYQIFGLRLLDGRFQVDGDPAYVRAACEGSLKRLDVDSIDLYYQHRINTKISIELTVSSLSFQFKVYNINRL